HDQTEEDRAHAASMLVLSHPADRARAVGAGRELVVPAVRIRVGRVQLPGAHSSPARSRRAATIGGPSSVMSPAPLVSTRCPGLARLAPAVGTAARSGTNAARPPGTASLISLPVTPGSGSSRAA